MNSNDLSWAGAEMAGIFNGLSKLESLSLADNGISSISYLAFSGVNNLKILNLSGNNLRSIQENPWAQMPFMRHLSLDVSSLMCDCLMKWLPVWLKQQPFAQETHPTCYYPDTLRGVSLLNVAPENFSCGKCSKPVSE